MGLTPKVSEVSPLFYILEPAAWKRLGELVTPEACRGFWICVVVGVL